AATHHTALVSAQAAQAQQQRLQAIAPQQQGHYPGDINGQPALKAHNAGRDLDNGQPVERFQHPFIHLDSAASMAWATPNSTTVFAGGQLNWTTQADSHWAAANTAASVSAHATTLFTHQGGIQAIAADGPVSLQAHTGPLDILADQALTVTSVNGRIEIKAKDTITLQAGQTAITLDGGNITFTCPGQFTVHASRHPFEGGSREAAVLNPLPDGTLPPETTWLELKRLDSEQQPIPGSKFSITFANGERKTGVLDQNGFARLENVPLGFSQVFYEDNQEPLNRQPVSRLTQALLKG
ncbi:MAG: type VI secretion system tip protein VgrG, partial [Methylomonas sp.]